MLLGNKLSYSYKYNISIQYLINIVTKYDIYKRQHCTQYIDSNKCISHKKYKACIA